MKYLTEILEQTNSIHISRIAFIFQEILHHEPQKFNETIGDFCNLKTSEICQVLGFTQSQQIIYDISSSIVHGEFMQFCFDRNRAGMIAEIHVPTCTDFYFDSDGEVKGYSPMQGVCHIAWAYADTLPELVHKLTKINNLWFDYDLRKWKKEHIKNRNKK